MMPGFRIGILDAGNSNVVKDSESLRRNIWEVILVINLHW